MHWHSQHHMEIHKCGWAEKEGGGIAGWLGWLVKENNDSKILKIKPIDM